MEQNSKFDKVMGAWDILVIAFGAMIGWGWVINSGDWITTVGFMGSIIAMLIGGAMVFFVGLTYADLVDKVVEQIGVDKGLVEEADTKIGVRYGFDTSYGVRYANLSNRVIDAQFQAIHDFAEKSSCVIVGRSSDYILRDRNDVLNVFIYAPEDDEVAAVMKEKGINERKAREEWESVEKAQHARHEYITGKKRGDRHTRDILLNSSLLGWRQTADFIIDLVERKYAINDEEVRKEA